ncbi:MAG TPA: hypothetical protein VIK52_03270, partial [Opitutaceae bacterium]
RGLDEETRVTEVADAHVRRGFGWSADAAENPNLGAQTDERKLEKSPRVFCCGAVSGTYRRGF